MPKLARCYCTILSSMSNFKMLSKLRISISLFWRCGHICLRAKNRLLLLTSWWYNGKIDINSDHRSRLCHTICHAQILDQRVCIRLTISLVPLWFTIIIIVRWYLCVWFSRQNRQLHCRWTFDIEFSYGNAHIKQFADSQCSMFRMIAVNFHPFFHAYGCRNVYINRNMGYNLAFGDENSHPCSDQFENFNRIIPLYL